MRLRAERIGDLYCIRRTTAEASLTSKKDKIITLDLLYRSLDHPCVRDISDAVRNKRVEGGVHLKNSAQKFYCYVCMKRKMSRTPFIRGSNRQSGILDIVDTDLCEPMRTEFLEGAN